MPHLSDRFMRIPADTIDCLGFFSRVPVAAGPPSELRTVSGAWPLCGLLLALGPALILFACRSAGMPGLVAAAMATAALIAVTGALHEDGLADTADGFGGGADKAEKLTIMRDSRIGGYGTLALAIVLLIKVAALGALSASAWSGFLALCGAAVASRTLALWYWRATTPAGPEGLAASVGQPDKDALFVGLATGGVAVVILAIQFGGAAIFAAILAGLAVIVLANLAHGQIGGHSGDTIGAAQQIADAMFLAGLSTAAGLAA